MKKDVMLTTIDNPYNPFTNFDEWWAFDISHGYNTCAYLSRIVDVFSENIASISDEKSIDKAMLWIVLKDPTENFALIDENGQKFTENLEETG